MKKLLFFFTFPLFFIVLLQSSAIAQLTRVADICPGSCSSSLAYPTLFNGKVYFQANSTATGVELWEYDGINAPSIVYDVVAGVGSSVPGDLLVYEDKLYFTVNNASELWVYDGINSPSLVYDFDLDYISLNLFQDELYIIAGATLWSYNGSGTPTSQGDFSVLGIKPHSILGSTGTNLYFTASNSANGTEIWCYSGSGLPTVMDINPGAGSSIGPVSTIVIGSSFYFVANDGTHGSELWVHNGTGSPTMVYDINSGSGNGATGMGGMAALGGKIYFQANTSGSGSEVWSYDGINTPTQLQDINPGAASSFPTWFVTIGSELFFNADDGMHGSELWKYDGNTVTLVEDVAPGALDFSPQHIFEFNNKVYMRGDGDGSDSEFWVYDPAITGIELAEAENDLRIFPNPISTSQLPMIVSEEPLTRIRIMTVAGETVYQGTNLQKISKPGMYFIELEQKGKHTVQRVVVK